jgi:hypothetical protein
LKGNIEMAKRPNKPGYWFWKSKDNKLYIIQVIECFGELKLKLVNQSLGYVNTEKSISFVKINELEESGYFHKWVGQVKSPEEEINEEDVFFISTDKSAMTFCNKCKHLNNKEVCQIEYKDCPRRKDNDGEELPDPNLPRGAEIEPNGICNVNVPYKYW